MDIVERRNHRFSVAYVKPAHDATVAYGVIDYRFKNSYDTPVKITASVSNGKLTMQIKTKKNSFHNF